MHYYYPADDSVTLLDSCQLYQTGPSVGVRTDVSSFSIVFTWLVSISCPVLRTLSPSSVLSTLLDISEMKMTKIILQITITKQSLTVDYFTSGVGNL